MSEKLKRSSTVLKPLLLHVLGEVQQRYARNAVSTRCTFPETGSDLRRARTRRVRRDENHAILLSPGLTPSRSRGLHDAKLVVVHVELLLLSRDVVLVAAQPQAIRRETVLLQVIRERVVQRLEFVNPGRDGRLVLLHDVTVLRLGVAVGPAEVTGLRCGRVDGVGGSVGIVFSSIIDTKLIA